MSPLHLRRQLLGWLCTLLLCAHPAPFALAAEITPDEVYQQVLRIEQEVALFRTHLQRPAAHRPRPLRAQLNPRHTWQLTYEILLKISHFRGQQGLPGFAPLAREPQTEVTPSSPWEQTQRILTELAILKAELGVAGEVETPPRPQGMQPIDVYNKLNEVSYAIDELTGAAIDASVVYAEAMRINEEINALMQHTATADNAVPPARRAEATAADALEASFVLMGQVQRLQAQLGVGTTDFSVFRRDHDVTSAEVLNMVGMCLAELQPLKQRMHLNNKYTPPAELTQGKTQTDITQLLLYEAAKLRLIQTDREHVHE